ncbi:MAG: M20/M25/M40 family metallo-hydrolase [Ignavibacteriales bacterium]|nr:M20/M25/M40 family metallo-hydrolase [Ignavibacteriales bacterium]
MKRLFQSLFFILFVLTTVVSSQQDPVVQKIIEIGKSDNQTMRHQDILCNRIGGRITGSDAYQTACNWVMSELKSWGLEVKLDEVGEFPVGFNRGPWFGKMIKPEMKNLEFVTPSYTAGTKGVQRGHVVIMPKTDVQFDSMKSKMKGAWVLIEGENTGWPRDRDSVVSLTKKLNAVGALGTIQLTKVPIRCLDSRCVNSWDNLPTLCDIKLVNTQFNEIKAMVEKNEEVILEFDVRNFFKPGPIKYHNVVATIPGEDISDEYVVLGAHLDSYDVATGAVDNASGVSPMMEAVRMLMKAGAKPKRTIILILFANEERGLVGSKSWVNKNKDLLGKISAMINKDFGTNPIVGISVPKVMANDFKNIISTIESANLKYPLAFSESSPFRKAGRGGTDSFSFLMEGVPTPGLRSQGPQAYGKTWHTPADTYDEIIPDAEEDAAIKIALMAYGIANLDHLLPREGAFLPDGIYADLNTNKGRITLNLDYKNVPMTVANFVGLAEGKIKNTAIAEGKPYFNGSLWHRVVPGHVIQAGMPVSKDTLEGPGYEFPNEIYTGLNHGRAGMLGMANAGPNTNGSQFYITLGDRSYLDGNYTLFGSVADGMDVVNKIVQGDTIKSLSITRIGEDANNFKVTDESFKKMVEEAKLKVKADDEKRSNDESEKIKSDFPNAVETPGGIKYIIKKEGTGNKPQNGSILTVKYTGKFLLNGREFVSTSIDGKPDAIETSEVFEYTIGKTKINPGLDEALADMKQGEVRTVIVPSSIAYGSNGFYGKSIPGKKRFVISPNTTLVYEIEIIK